MSDLHRYPKAPREVRQAHISGVRLVTQWPYLQRMRWLSWSGGSFGPEASPDLADPSETLIINVGHMLAVEEVELALAPDLESVPEPDPVTAALGATGLSVVGDTRTESTNHIDRELFDAYQEAWAAPQESLA